VASTPRRLGASIPGPLPPITDVGYGARITVFESNPEQADERRIAKIEAWEPPADDSTVTWIDVDDVRDPHVINQFGERFGIHPLEDIYPPASVPSSTSTTLPIRLAEDAHMEPADAHDAD
jgi:hypothetical protein